MIRYLLAAFIGGTLAVAAYIELSARRGVPAGPFAYEAGLLVGRDMERRAAWRDYERVDSV